MKIGLPEIWLLCLISLKRGLSHKLESEAISAPPDRHICQEKRNRMVDERVQVSNEHGLLPTLI